MDQKILIIDAHPVYIHKTENFLMGLTFKNIVLAKSGKDGIEKIKTEQPDLVILSAILPDVESSELCSLIKETNPAAKIIVQTGLLTEDSAVARFQQRGADEILPRKEKDLAPLQHALEKLLDLSRK